MERTDVYNLFDDGNIKVAKVIRVATSYGNRDVLLEKYPIVTINGYHLVGVKTEHNKDGDVTQNTYHLEAANTLVTLLDAFLSGKIPRSMRNVLAHYNLSAMIVMQGTKNLCLTLGHEDEVSTMYLTPFQASNLRNCIYHLLSTIARA